MLRRCISSGDYTEPVRALIFIAVLFATQALAQQWPQKPVRVIVPFPPGGVTDSIARITVDWLAPRLGQPIIAENKPGASGAIAAEFVARSAPDGYTLFMAASPQLAIVPHVQKIPYDPVKDFAPVSIVGASAFGLGVNDRLPPKSLAEFVDYVKARPGQLNFASPGAGTVGHLTMALFLARAGLRMDAVLYKGGGPATVDVRSGMGRCATPVSNEPARRDSRPGCAVLLHRHRGGRDGILRERRLRGEARAALPSHQDVRGIARRPAGFRRRRCSCRPLCVQGLEGRQAALRARATYVLVFGIKERP